MLFQSKVKIPLWVNLMQAVLIAIMLGQVVQIFFFTSSLADAGIAVDSVPMQNLVYEMAARTLVMALASIFVMVTQNALQFVVVLIMNIAREGFETIIDPLYPVANAPVSPGVDLVMHLIIITIEILALIVVLRRLRRWGQS